MFELPRLPFVVVIEARRKQLGCFSLKKCDGITHGDTGLGDTLERDGIKLVMLGAGRRFDLLLEIHQITKWNQVTRIGPDIVVFQIVY